MKTPAMNPCPEDPSAAASAMAILAERCNVLPGMGTSCAQFLHTPVAASRYDGTDYRKTETKLNRFAMAGPLLALAASATQAQAVASHEIPMEMYRDHPTVQVRIGQEESPLRFVVDTAAGVTVLDSDATHRLGLADAAAESVAVSGATDAAAQIRRTREADWRIGGLELRLSAMHTGLAHLAGGGDGPRIDGILGNDVLREWDMVLSIPAARMLLSPPRTLPDAPHCQVNALPDRPEPMAGFGFIELRMGDQGVPVIAVVDTGAAQTVLNVAAAEALGLAMDGSDDRVRVREKGTRGLGAAVADTWLYTLPVLRSNGWEHPPFEVRISALSIFSVLGLDSRPALILGADALLDSELAMAAQASRICLKRADAR
ncbi:MAG: retroviral-like aspartic protease family protein [Pseudomonadota bacterium]